MCHQTRENPSVKYKKEEMLSHSIGKYGISTYSCSPMIGWGKAIGIFQIWPIVSNFFFLFQLKTGEWKILMKQM